MLTITSPYLLRLFGWNYPAPSYVTAPPRLWLIWFRQALRGR